MNNMRYFIIFYSARNEHGNLIETFTVSKAQGYLNYKTFCDDIEKERGFTNVSMKNLIELNESDFNDFTKDIE